MCKLPPHIRILGVAGGKSSVAETDFSWTNTYGRTHMLSYTKSTIYQEIGGVVLYRCVVLFRLFYFALYKGNTP